MITIRKLTGEDAEEYRRLRLQSLQDYPSSFVDSVDEESSSTLEDIRKKLEKRSTCTDFIAGAFKGDELVGVVGFYQYPLKKIRHKGYIWGMYVHSRYHGMGIGTRLLKYVKEQAQKCHGLEQIQLTVSCRNVKAKRLYQKAGFKTYGVEKQALKVDGEYYDEEHMMMFV
ncbi:MAG: N-acetyltransferase [Bacillaceae bacterium]|nr:N-acetyltransferase [Bacillaceae bacterium]